MLPHDQAPKRPNFAISNQLLGIDESPLSHPPGYSGNCSPSYPWGNPKGNPAGYSESNVESYPESYPENYAGRYSPGNP
jgi:hypothetical protein